MFMDTPLIKQEICGVDDVKVLMSHGLSSPVSHGVSSPVSCDPSLVNRIKSENDIVSMIIQHIDTNVSHDRTKVVSDQRTVEANVGSPPAVTSSSSTSLPPSTDGGYVLKPSISGDKSSSIENLRDNAYPEYPQCTCRGPGYVYNESEEGPFYTHLGSASDYDSLRTIMEERTGLKGNAIRIEKLAYTGKEGKSTAGCPIAKWIIRRSSPEEKVLVTVKKRPGHMCSTAVIVINIVVWEGVSQYTADDLYSVIVRNVATTGYETERRCGTNDNRSCACQGWSLKDRGASFSFGCSWSMYYNGCKYARSREARKFKLKDEVKEEEFQGRMQNLATDVAKLYKVMAPDSYNNQCTFSKEAQDCRLGFDDGKPFAGVTMCVDFCAHAHRDIHNMNNGCTVVVTLTKHKPFERTADEQLHVLPCYIPDVSDETDRINFQHRVKSGAIEILHNYPIAARIRKYPDLPCKQRGFKGRKQRSVVSLKPVKAKSNFAEKFRAKGSLVASKVRKILNSISGSKKVSCSSQKLKSVDKFKNKDKSSKSNQSSADVSKYSYLTVKDDKPSQLLEPGLMPISGLQGPSNRMAFPFHYPSPPVNGTHPYNNYSTIYHNSSRLPSYDSFSHQAASNTTKNNSLLYPPNAWLQCNNISRFKSPSFPSFRLPNISTRNEHHSSDDDKLVRRSCNPSQFLDNNGHDVSSLHSKSLHRRSNSAFNLRTYHLDNPFEDKRVKDVYAFESDSSSNLNDFQHSSKLLPHQIKVKNEISQTFLPNPCSQSDTYFHPSQPQAYTNRNEMTHPDISAFNPKLLSNGPNPNLIPECVKIEQQPLSFSQPCQFPNVAHSTQYQMNVTLTQQPSLIFTQSQAFPANLVQTYATQQQRLISPQPYFKENFTRHSMSLEPIQPQHPLANFTNAYHSPQRFFSPSQHQLKESFIRRPSVESLPPQNSLTNFTQGYQIQEKSLESSTDNWLKKSYAHQSSLACTQPNPPLSNVAHLKQMQQGFIGSSDTSTFPVNQLSQHGKLSQAYAIVDPNNPKRFIASYTQAQPRSEAIKESDRTQEIMTDLGHFNQTAHSAIRHDQAYQSAHTFPSDPIRGSNISSYSPTNHNRAFPAPMTALVPDACNNFVSNAGQPPHTPQTMMPPNLPNNLALNSLRDHHPQGDLQNSQSLSECKSSQMFNSSLQNSFSDVYKAGSCIEGQQDEISANKTHSHRNPNTEINLSAHTTEASVDPLASNIDKLFNADLESCQPITIETHETGPDSDIIDGSTEYQYNTDPFRDPRVGGVAIALDHGAVLFEVAKRELHATTALKRPNRFAPKRISMVFYQHKNLNLARHGAHEYDCKQEALRQKRAQKAEEERVKKETEELENIKQTITDSLNTQNSTGFYEAYKQLINSLTVHKKSSQGADCSMPQYKYLWDMPTNFCHTGTTSSFITQWRKPQDFVSGPYQTVI